MLADGGQGSDTQQKSATTADTADIAQPKSEQQVVDLSNIQTVGFWSWEANYWKCVNGIGLPVAYAIFSHKWYQVPPWYWGQVRQYCSAYINGSG